MQGGNISFFGRNEYSIFKYSTSIFECLIILITSIDKTNFLLQKYTTCKKIIDKLQVYPLHI